MYQYNQCISITSPFHLAGAELFFFKKNIQVLNKIKTKHNDKLVIIVKLNYKVFFYINKIVVNFLNL